MNIKTIFVLSLFCSAVCLPVSAGMPVDYVPAHEERIEIWPEGAPNSNGRIVTAEDSLEWNVVSNPVLHLFKSDNPSGKVVLMLPGGGYRHLGVQNEGYSFVDWYNGQGIDVAVLQYRMPYGHPDVPLSDVHRSMRILRERFPESLVGVQGFSAGGHLASTAATHYTDHVTRPDFQILFYPVIKVIGSDAHPGSRDRMVGENASEDMLALYDNHRQVSPDTPKAFIVHSADDSIVPVSNSLDYFSSLRDNGVEASLHIYPKGDHGWGFYDGFAYKPEWTAELAKWISLLK